MRDSPKRDRVFLGDGGEGSDSAAGPVVVVAVSHVRGCVVTARGRVSGRMDCWPDHWPAYGDEGYGHVRVPRHWCDLRAARVDGAGADQSVHGGAGGDDD